jgi:hypothetical protein
MSTGAITRSVRISSLARASGARLALAAVALLMAATLVGCRAEALAQPIGGDGWRLIGWARGGTPTAPRIGADAEAALSEMGLIRIAGTTPPPGRDEVSLLFTHAVSSSCPRVRLDGLRIEGDVVEALLTDASDSFNLGGCTDDANPVVWWLAVERHVLPDGTFTLRTEKSPELTTTVDAGDL